MMKWTAVAVLLSACSASGADYLRDVKPLLREKCYACHGALKQEGGLRLDTGVAIRAGGESGEAVAAGDAGASLLLERVSAEDAAERMPPEGEPLTPEQIAALRKWIDAGADSPADEVPEADPRAHWAFRPLRRPEVPAAGPGRRANPIDAFINRRLADRRLTPRPRAGEAVLLRRLHLDLIGLPPTPAQLHELLGDSRPDAYQRAVDRLLSSPRYGERWARHWMDIWRYSDWYGRRHVPDVWNGAPQVWRWRDWIVRSLNDDKGYDQMVREMLAADELRPGDRHAAAATGYLVRNWYALNPNDWMRNNVEHTGKAFLGLTFNCAHCHDHKYDPIAQDDYFRLRAFFEPIYVRQDRVPGEADPGPFQDYEYSTLRKIQPLGQVQVFDKSPDAPTWFYTGGDERNRVTERGSVEPGVPSLLAAGLPPIESRELPPRAWYPGLQPEIQQTVRAEAQAAVDQAQAELASAQAAAGDRATDELAVRAAEASMAAARAELESVEARVAADRAAYGETPDADPTALAREAHRRQRVARLARLEADVLAAEVAKAEAEAKPQDDSGRAKAVEAATKALAAARAELAKARAVEVDPQAADYDKLSPVYPSTSTGRRAALAQWITSRENPLTARVAVNHLWARHFHVPLVATVDNFGRNGAEPTHPELLDWLAVELVESGWSLKHLHRLIVTSEAYRRVSSVGDATSQASADVENRLLWRMNTGRMEAEVIRDSLLHCADMLDLTVGGPPQANKLALTTHRRSLYYEVFPEDGGASPFAVLFDAPNPLECYRRTRSIVPQQALALTNSEMVHRVSTAIVRDWQASHGAGGDAQVELDDDAFIAAMFQRILSRRPSAEEHAVCGQALQRQFEIHSASNTSDTASDNAPDRSAAAVRARESLVRALLNHNDFVAVR